ncbi:hypothetical protein CRE_04278 [Caenorhabditis remanei]|uniref:EGF-like domain-containing protein n=1 Tax=Caenorhabditis remanei TaxID=31234 RepID=E3NAS9_CAERE|nr:hypothetical protein CRE_04278 [Caenorhabditis remanei]
MAITVSELLNGVASRLIYEGSPCDSHPCWNEGKCMLNGSSNYFCECPPAFIGLQCEYRVSIPNITNTLPCMYFSFSKSAGQSGVVHPLLPSVTSEVSSPTAPLSINKVRVK